MRKKNANYTFEGMQSAIYFQSHTAISKLSPIQSFKHLENNSSTKSRNRTVVLIYNIQDKKILIDNYRLNV